MGFAWSSYIALCEMLHVCRTAGLLDRQVLAEDVKPPVQMRSVFVLATDDIIHFSSIGRQHSEQVATKIDKGFERCGVQRHPAKDITGVKDGSCNGTQLSDGLYFSPAPASLLLVLQSVVHCFDNLEASLPSPLHLALWLGVAQWHCLLNRPSLSIFHTIYDAVRRTPQHKLTTLDLSVALEMLQFVLLAPLLEADSTRPWHHDLVATDASPSFGFGVAALRVGCTKVREVGRLAHREQEFLQLEDPDAAGAKTRVGVPRKLPYRKSDFRCILSTVRDYDGHAGALEASAIVLVLRWLLRCSTNHSKRIALLVDAQAVLCAAAIARDGRHPQPCRK
jgi:hypothetical protein